MENSNILNVLPIKKNRSLRPFTSSRVNNPSKFLLRDRIQVDDDLDPNDETIATVISALLSLKYSFNNINMPTDGRKTNDQDLDANREEKRQLVKTRLMVTAATNDDTKSQEWIMRKIEEMGGTNVTMVMEKVLYNSDVSESNCRLSMPLRKILNPSMFMTNEEIKFLDEENERPNSIPVKMIDPNGCVIDGMELRKWTMNGRAIYNLVCKWIQLVKTNKLEKGMTIRLWSFRIQSALCFALSRVV